MACIGPLPSTSKHDRDDCQRDGGRGQELMLEDEFTCAGALRGALMMLHPSVERIFGVNFRVGTGEDDDLPHSDGQIWLKLNGQTKNVSAAKLFVKGVVNQEEQQEVSYPGVLHCVFYGARGLFMDCLIKNTSAHIVIGSLGCLLISGLTEPVVKAFSLITDLVNRYQSAQGPRTVTGDWGPGEFLDSRRAFKHLVERCNDGSTLDLLVLPGTVKESLLDLVKESGLRSNAGLVVSPGEGELSSIPQTSESSRGLFITDGRELNVEVGELREMAHGLQHNRIIDYFHQDSTHVRDPHARLHSPGGSSLESPFWTAHGREQQGDGIRKGSTADPLFHSFPDRENNSRHAEQASRDQTEFRGQSPQEVGEEGELGEGKKEEEHGESVGSKKEFGLLLKFFTAMGYTEDVVMSVLARTGPKEASQILDLVQQEQDRSDRKQSRNRPSETEHVEEKRDAMGAGRSDMAARKRNTDRKENRPGLTAGDEGAGRDPDFGEVAEVGRDRGGGREEEEEEEEKYGGNREDFVLGVLKRAAATCGYTEQKVEEVYGMLPGNSTHQLLLELQREGAREAQRPIAVGGMRRGEEEPREVDEAALEAQRELNQGGRMEVVLEQSVARAEREEAIRSRKERKTMECERGDHPKQTVALPEPSEWIARNRLSAPQPAWLPAAKLDTRAPQIKGPPQHTYSSAVDPKANQSARKTPQPSQPTPPLPIVDPQLFKHPKPALQPTYLASSDPFHNPSKFLQPTKPDPQPMSPALFKFVPPQPATFDLPASRERNKLGLPAVPSGKVVTGEQRFLESLQTPFELKLTNDPGDPGLRGIIIDGSNVAMSHGRGYFFSCRGIALAVQHFWNRGHREITTFLPQWRQKRDHRVKEHHFLTELQNLGMISYTPSREFEGKKISSYDDRFMLQLAEKKDGVIVTNDNLRDLVDESRGFRDIIKKGLLQYTFVDNLFMVPDDPLGRGGPHLDDFLRSQNRTPIPGSHSFAGLASSFTSPKTNCSQTEVLQLRDRTPMAPAKPEFSQQGHQQGRGQDKASPHSARQRQRTSLDAGLQRSEKDTAILREQLCQVFPGQDSMVALVLQSNHTEKDINILSDFILEQQGESLMEH